MATIRELAGVSNQTNKTQITGSAIGSLNPAKVQAEQVLDSRVAQVANTTKGLMDTSKAMYETAEEARRLRAVDRKTELVAGLKKIEDTYEEKIAKGEALTSQDYKDKKEWRERFYSEMVQGGIDFEEDVDSTTYKDVFVKPSLELVDRLNSNDNANYLKLALKEEQVKVKDKIDVLGVNISPDDINTYTSTLTKLGDKEAKKRVHSYVATSLNSDWSSRFKNGVHSEYFSAQLQEVLAGKKTLNQAFTEEYNKVFGKFVKLNSKGVFEKKDNTLSDEAYSAMQKGYSSWFSVLKKSNGKQQKIDATALYAAKGINVNNTMEQIDNSLNDVYKQFAEVKIIADSGANTDAYSKLDDFRNTMVKLGEVKAKKEYLEGAFARYNKSITNDTGNLVGGNINVIVKSLSGFDDVVKPSNVEDSEVIAYVQKKYVDNIRKLSTSGVYNKDTVDKMESYAIKLAALENDGIRGSGVEYANQQVKRVSNMNMFNSAKTAEDIVNNITFAASYRKASGDLSFTGVNDNLVKTVTDYYRQLKEREPDIDNNTLLTRVKSLASATVANGGKFSFSETSKGLKQLGIDTDGSDGDELTVGYYPFGLTAGRAKFGQNSLNIAIDLAIKNNDGYSLEQDDAKSLVKNNMIILDPSKFVGGGTQLAIVKPSATMDDDVARKNFEDIVKERLYKNAAVKDIDFKDIVDEERIRISQHNDVEHGLVTIVKFIDNGGKVSTAVITADEWKNGVTSGKKFDINKKNKSAGEELSFPEMEPKSNKFNSFGNDKLF